MTSLNIGSMYFARSSCYASNQKIFVLIISQNGPLEI